MANLVAGTMSPSLSKTGDEGSGTLYHVVGSILRGMEYQRREGHHFSKSFSFVPGTDVLNGNVQSTDLSRFDRICESVPARVLN